MAGDIITLRNSFLQVTISTLGAELQSVFCRQTGIEYLWQGDANFWGKRSPVLFPIVGGLKNNSYTFQGNTYPLGRHGFAREQLFELVEVGNTKAVFELTHSAETLAKYPFLFTLQLQYQLTNSGVTIQYRVKNTGEQTLYFSLGAHPAFNVPFLPNTSFTDYHLAFDVPEDAAIWPLTADGLIADQPMPYLQNQQTIALQKQLFAKDALVFKQLRSNAISIVHTATNAYVKVSYQQFPFMGIWSTKQADFVCIEPWCGIADSEHATGNLEQKEGIETLASQSLFERQWEISFSTNS